MSERKVNDRLKTITGETFASLVLDGKGPVAVEFMSYGCGHCQTIEPILQQVAKMVDPEEKMFRVNIAVEQELAERCEIKGTPTLIMFLNGEVFGRVEGPSPDVGSVLEAVTAPFGVSTGRDYANV